MKKIKSLVIALFSASILFGATSCGSTSVERISSDTVTDLSGYWNDTDVKIVAESLVSECANSRAVIAFNAEKKRNPVIIVGTFANQSDEHIDTSIISKKFEIALINSGNVDFVASSSERSEIRDERADQQVNSSEDTASSVGNETGADFMLKGAVKTIVDSNGKDSARTYYVTAELINIETNKKLWMGENSSIKKYIKKANYR